MNVTQEIAEARALALRLRKVASVCAPAQGVLKVRLVSAAESLDAMALLSTRALDRIEQLTGVNLVPLQQAGNLLEIVAEVGKHGDFGDDGEDLVAAIGVARRLINDVLGKLAASRSGGAS